MMAADAPTGGVMAWGISLYGEIGDGKAPVAGGGNYSLCVPVLGLMDATAVSAGGSHSLALTADGMVWSWGCNIAAQLGDGTKINRAVPAQVVDLNDVVAISAGNMHNLAVKGDGTVWAWGANLDGELGQEVIRKENTADLRPNPVQVPGLTGMVAVAAGQGFSLALKSDGTVWAWGRNFNGELGGGNYDSKEGVANPKPAQVKGLANISAVAAGSEHALALTSDGAVWSWGSNSRGPLGQPALRKPNVTIRGPGDDGREQVFREAILCTTPAPVVGIQGKVTAIAACCVGSLALTSDGAVWSWGDHTPRKLTAEEMQGSSIKPEDNILRLQTSTYTPTRIEGLSGVTAIATGKEASFAMKGDGTVVAWGENYCGQLGSGDLKKSVVPVPVKGLAGARSIASGYDHTLASFGAQGDPFWKWYPGFSRFVKEQRKIYEAARGKAATVGGELRSARRSMAALNAVVFPGTAATNDPLPEAMRKRMIERIGQLGQTIADERRDMEDQMKAASDAITHIRRELQNREPAFGKAHPVMGNNIRFYQDLYDQIPLTFALLEGDQDSFRYALQLGKELDYSASTRVLESRALWYKGDSVDSLFTMRRAAGLEPKNIKIQKEFAELEAIFIRAAMEKSQAAIALARADFTRYMGESGFAKREEDGTYDLRDSKGFTAEQAWAIMTTGVTRSTSALLGRADEEARALDATEGAMVRAYKGLHVMLRLRLLRHGFDEIRNMKSPEIMKLLPLKDTQGRDYTDPQAALLASYLHEAMKLPDIKPLMGNDPAAIKDAMDTGYWDPNDVGNTWAEWFTDLSSPKNLALLANPFTIGSTGGRLPMAWHWGKAELATLEVARAEGMVLSGSHVLARMSGWKLAADLLKGSRVGDAVVTGLENSLEYYNSGGAWWKGYITARTVVGSMIIQHYMVTTAKDVGGVYAGMMMEGFLLFRPDSEFLLKYLKTTDLPPVQVAAAARQLATGARQEAQQATSALSNIEKVRGIQRKARAANLKVPAAAEQKELEQIVAGIEPDPNVVTVGEIFPDIALPARAAPQAAKAGVQDGSTEALEEMAEDLKKHVGELEQVATDADNLAAKLTAPAVPLPALPPTALENELFLVRNGERLVFEVRPDSMYGKAEAALHSGDFEAARDLYQQAHAFFMAAKHDREAVILTLKVKMAQELAALKAARIVVPPRAKGLSAESTPLTPQDLAEILKLKWTPLGKASQGFMGIMHEVEGGKYMVKLLKNESRADALLEAEGEVVAARLARELGFDASVVTMFEKDGRIYLASRRIDGDALGGQVKIGDRDVSLAQTFLYRDELSEHRMLAYVLGDFDRHASNYMVSRDGTRVFAIDAGLADPRGAVAQGRGLSLNSPEAVHGAFGRDSILLNRTGQIMSKDPKIGRDLLAELSLSYKPEAAKRVGDLLNDQARLSSALKEAYTNVYPGKSAAEIDTMVTKAARTMNARFENLEPTMQNLINRNLGRRPSGGWIFPTSRDLVLPYESEIPRMLLMMRRAA